MAHSRCLERGIVMDLLCERCGEPWDLLGMQDEWTESQRRYFNVGRGCPACGGREESEFAHRAEGTSFARMAQAALRDVMGDDLDGLAASMEDFGLA